MAREHPDVTKAVRWWPIAKINGYTMTAFAKKSGLSRSAIYKALARRKMRRRTARVGAGAQFN